MVSYNCRDLLADCLRSIQDNHDGLELEIVVVDNASEDATVEMVNADFPSVRVIAQDENAGFAAGMNRAVEAARGDTLVLLNPDTKVRQGALKHMAQFIREHRDIGGCGPAVYGPQGELQQSCHVFPRLWLTFIAQLGLHRAFRGSRIFGAYDMTWWDHARPRPVDWLSGVCITTRRDVWERVGPLDEGYFMYAEDIDWCYRLEQAGLARYFLPDAQIEHREGASWGEASQERILASHRASFRFFGKNYGAPAEIVERLLVASGAMARGCFWNIMGPVFDDSTELVTSADTHFNVVLEAMAMEDIYLATQHRED